MDEEYRMQPEVNNGETEDDRSEQVSSSNEADGVVPEPQASPLRKYPLRQRNPLRTFAYNTLGQWSTNFF